MTAASPGGEAHPALGLRFDVTIDVVDIGSFTGCEGLQAEYELFEYTEGGENAYIHRLPGRLKYSNVKLSRPLDANSRGLAEWFSQTVDTISRKPATIAALDSFGREVARWNLRDVVPVKWTGPTFASDGNAIAKETLELAHNGFEMVVA
jgi:phage tail-like protein